MCYYTTYLFSLCGHTSISSQPIKYAKPCLRAQQLLTAPDTPVSMHAVALSFPSPEEFEFAKHIHDSIPASPISLPASKNRIPIDVIDACTFSTLSAKATTTSEESCVMKISSSAGPPCSATARHPLHTYKLPFLCPACQLVRLQNIAHFEAQSIRESVEREQYGHGIRGVIDPARKTITRCSAVKRKTELIPLICVEEQRIQREGLEREKEGQERRDMAAKAKAVEVEVAIDDRIGGQAQVKGLEKNMVGGNRENTNSVQEESIAVEAPQDAHSLTDSLVPIVPHSWGSWWRGVESATSSRVPSLTLAKIVPTVPKTIIKGR